MNNFKKVVFTVQTRKKAVIFICPFSKTGCFFLLILFLAVVDFSFTTDSFSSPVKSTSFFLFLGAFPSSPVKSSFLFLFCSAASFLLHLSTFFISVRIERLDNFDLGGFGAFLASCKASSAAFIPSRITLDTLELGVEDSADITEVAPSVLTFLSFDLRIKGLVSLAQAIVDVNLHIPSLDAFAGVAILDTSTLSFSVFSFSSSTNGVLNSETILGQTIGVDFEITDSASSDSILPNILLMFPVK